jgi:hypothetical protein
MVTLSLQWYTWEEVNKINPEAAPNGGYWNNGWPCFEGGNENGIQKNQQQAEYWQMSLRHGDICNKLATSNQAIVPYISYKHPPNQVGTVSELIFLLFCATCVPRLS